MATAKKPSAKTGKQKFNGKWGKNVAGFGHTAVPNILIERQQVLKLTPVQLNILLILLKHYWEEGNHPYPSRKRIAELINRDPGTVTRNIQQMEAEGLVQRVERKTDQGQTTNLYNLDGLAARLDEIAQEEMAIAKERAKEDGRKRRGR